MKLGKTINLMFVTFCLAVGVPKWTLRVTSVVPSLYSSISYVRDYYCYEWGLGSIKSLSRPKFVYCLSKGEAELNI
jgi:hypothetical protein